MSRLFLYRRIVFLLAVVLGLFLTLHIREAPQASFVSRASGDWHDPATWAVESGEPKAAIPTAADGVRTLFGHEIRVEPGAPAAEAATLRIEGVVLLPPPQPGQPGAELRSLSMHVAADARLEARGAHRLVLGPDRRSELIALPGGELVLEGEVRVADGTVSRVVEEGDEYIVLEDLTRNWRPGELAGYRLQLTDGRARLWQLAIEDNTPTTVTLRLGELGSPVNRLFGAHLVGEERRSLSTPADTLEDFGDEPWNHSLLGRWVTWEGASGEERRSLITGQIAGPPGAPDTLFIWPPVPEGDQPPGMRLTYGIAAGDRYRISRPLEVTVAEEHRLPSLSMGQGYRIVLDRGSRGWLQDLSIGYGAVRLQQLDTRHDDSDAHLRFLDIHHGNPSCYIRLQQVYGVRLTELRLRDIHPNTKTKSQGGIWGDKDQRGHGICALGHDLLIANNRITHLNDDLIWVADAGGVVVRDNIAVSTGHFDGRSFEALGAIRLEGDLDVHGNILMGAMSALRIGSRPPDSKMTVQGNLLAQDEHEDLFVDSPHDDSGPLYFRDNLVLGSAGKRMRVTFSRPPAELRGNYFAGIRWHRDSAVRPENAPRPPAMPDDLPTDETATER